jgi:hypothetical protein
MAKLAGCLSAAALCPFHMRAICTLTRGLVLEYLQFFRVVDQTFPRSDPNRSRFWPKSLLLKRFMEAASALKGYGSIM